MKIYLKNRASTNIFLFPDFHFLLQCAAVRPGFPAANEQNEQTEPQV